MSYLAPGPGRWHHPWLTGAGQRSGGGSRVAGRRAAVGFRAGRPAGLRPGHRRMAAGATARFRAGLPPDSGRGCRWIPGPAAARFPAGPPPDSGPTRRQIPDPTAARFRPGPPPDSRPGRRQIPDGAGRIRPGCRWASARPLLPPAGHAVDLRRRSVSARRPGRAEVTRSNNPTRPYTGQIVITPPKDSRISVRAMG
jgi:hypothetical protein